MRKLSLLISLAAAFLGVQAAVHAAPPARLEVVWQLTKDGSAIAEIVQKLEYGDGKYEITELWQGRGLFRLLGSAKRLSRGEVGADGLRPLEYTDERSGRDTERAKFDWQAKTVTYQFKGPATTIPLPANPRDKLQFLMQFAFKPPSGSKIALDVIDGRGISDQIYQLEGREQFRTAAGEFDALKLVRRKEGNERAEIWLAADRGYLPVRILIIDKNGTRLDQVVTRIAVPGSGP
jgi:hypothetical protein